MLRSLSLARRKVHIDPASAEAGRARRLERTISDPLDAVGRDPKLRASCLPDRVEAL